MKKFIKLSKPTNLQLLKGLVISLIQSLLRGYLTFEIPNNIDKYHLIQKVNKENMLNGYAVGIYQNNGEKVFIKTWRGKIKNYGYYDLVNEFVTSRILYRKIEPYNLKNKKNKIKIPKPIKYISSKDSFSIISEYIDGKILTAYSLHTKVRILANIIEALYKVSNDLTEEEKKQLLIRGKYFYILSLPILSIMTCISNPKIGKAVFRAFLECLKTFKFLGKENSLCIAHRDLNLHNILVNKRGAYIVDWSRAALTVPGYDITYLSIRPGLELIANLVAKKLNLEPNLFFKNQILIHLSQSFGGPEGYDNPHAKQLYKLYA